MKKNKKGKGKVIRTTIILLLVVVGMCLACIPLFKDLKFGLDLQGGFEILYQVDSIDGSKMTHDKVMATYRTLSKRIDMAEVVDPATRPATDQVFFGATVTYEDEEGQEHTIRIVGIDEADASVGDVSWISPIARVFLKAHEGDTVTLPTPSGVQHLEIVEVKYC